MKAIKIKGTEDTPLVILDPASGSFEISGKSLPESVTQFYNPLFDWIEKYISNPIESTILKFKLEYFNSATSKIISEIITLFVQIQDKGKEIKIEWHFPEDDEEMLEAGQEYSSIAKFPFEYHKYVFED
jgi:hypothetical protein